MKHRAVCPVCKKGSFPEKVDLDLQKLREKAENGLSKSAHFCMGMEPEEVLALLDMIEKQKEEE